METDVASVAIHERSVDLEGDSRRRTLVPVDTLRDRAALDIVIGA